MASSPVLPSAQGCLHYKVITLLSGLQVRKLEAERLDASCSGIEND